MAKRDFLVSIDFNQNEIVQAVLQNAATLPATGTNGQLIYKTPENVPYFWDSNAGPAAWVPFDTGIGIQTVTADDGITVSGTSTDVVVSVDYDNSSIGSTDGSATGKIEIKNSGVVTAHLADSTGVADGVTLAKMRFVPTLTALARTASGTGLVEETEIVTSITNDVNTKLVTEGAVYRFVNASITALGALVGDWDASGTTFPTIGVDGGTNPIQKGDYWYISVAGTMGTHVVNVGDVLYAKVADGLTPPSAIPGQVSANWFVVEANYFQATESAKGVAEIATQVETDAGTDDERIVTPKKLSDWYQNKHVVSSFEDTIVGNAVLIDFPITHNLGTTYVQVELIEDTTKATVEAQYVRTSANVVTVSFNTAPASAKQYNIIITGTDYTLNSL